MHRTYHQTLALIHERKSIRLLLIITFLFVETTCLCTVNFCSTEAGGFTDAAQTRPFSWRSFTDTVVIADTIAACSDVTPKIYVIVQCPEFTS